MGSKTLKALSLHTLLIAAREVYRFLEMSISVKINSFQSELILATRRFDIGKIKTKLMENVIIRSCKKYFQAVLSSKGFKHNYHLGLNFTLELLNKTFDF